jgi:hypothetical protein
MAEQAAELDLIARHGDHAHRRPWNDWRRRDSATDNPLRDPQSPLRLSAPSVLKTERVLISGSLALGTAAFWRAQSAGAPGERSSQDRARVPKSPERGEGARPRPPHKAPATRNSAAPEDQQGETRPTKLAVSSFEITRLSSGRRFLSPIALFIMAGLVPATPEWNGRRKRFAWVRPHARPHHPPL